MKRHGKLLFSICAGFFSFIFILFGCTVTNEKLFSNVQTTTDTTYGYTIKNPIATRNGDSQQSIGASYYYMSHLRTSEDKRLLPLMQYAIYNPDYKQGSIQLENRFTGMPMGGRGMFLDMWIYKVENTNDTIRLYYNCDKKDTIRVPVGLKFIQ